MSSSTNPIAEKTALNIELMNGLDLVNHVASKLMLQGYALESFGIPKDGKTPYIWIKQAGKNSRFPDVPPIRKAGGVQSHQRTLGTHMQGVLVKWNENQGGRR